MRVDMETDDAVEVQMAPLIDCVFLLLIFFLVATTLKKIEKELPLDPPKASASVSRQVVDDMLIIAIDQEGNLYLDSEPVGQSYLVEKLREVGAEDPERRIRIDTDRQTPMWAVVQVLDMLKFENLTNVGIKTQAPEEPTYDI
ncbi:MAG: ExbD/TolR family protein [Planctomycetota bacterium]